MSKWISVKDRLPDEEGEYLVCLKGMEVSSASYECGNWVVVGLHGYLIEVANVTHWQPLPEPPKEDEV